MIISSNVSDIEKFSTRSPPKVEFGIPRVQIGREHDLPVRPGRDQIRSVPAHSVSLAQARYRACLRRSRNSPNRMWKETEGGTPRSGGGRRCHVERNDRRT